MYDPILGAFASVDPVMDLADPQQWHGYTYSHNNPTTFSDPTGLREIANDDPRDDTQAQIASAVGHSLGRSSQPPVFCAAPPYVPPTVWEQYSEATVSVAKEYGHDGVDVVGLFPVAGIPADVANAIWYYSENDYLNGTLSAIGTIPVLGEGVVAGKWVFKGGKWVWNALSGARACSFAGATLVLMADGSEKPIEDVRVGDEVIASDPETGEQEPRKVTQVFVHEDTVIDLALDDGTVLGTTENHPFWSVTDQKFERADELTMGEQVLTADGRTLTVGGLRYGTSRTALAYNLSVDGIHTYHVGAGAILVHNKCKDFSDEVEQGLDHMEDEIDAGNTSHIIDGVGDPCTEAGRCAVGSYLTGFEGRQPDFADMNTGAGILVDRSGKRPIVVVQKPWQLHAYHADEEYVASKIKRGEWEQK